LTEFGAVGYECPEQAGFHIDETSVFVEVIDRDGQPVEEGEEGEIVISSVLNEAMPLLRYRTGDLGVFTWKQCRCGVPGPRILRLSGLKVFCLRFEDGRLTSPAHFNNFLSIFPITEFQITQVTMTRIDVLVEPKAGIENLDQLLQSIQQHISEFVPRSVEVRVRAASFDYTSRFERFRTLVW
jgi:phenylacetate-CoA ligase